MGETRRKGERGATIVEMAIVLPILLLLVIGMLELGVAFKSYLTVSAAVRDGARVAALAGNDPEADCAVLREIGGALAGGGEIAGLERVEIFKASPGNGEMQGLPNTYTLNIAGDPGDCDDWARASYGYPEASRGTTVGATAQLDIIAVRVVANRSWITGLTPFSGSYTLDDVSLRRLEPEAYE